MQPGGHPRRLRERIPIVVRYDSRLTNAASPISDMWKGAQMDDSPSAFRDVNAAADLDAQGPSADLVRVYLNGIGKTALLTAEQEVDLAKRIEAGLYAQFKLDNVADLTSPPADRPAPPRPGRRNRPPAPAGGQPAPGRLAGQALLRSRHAAARPDPGGQPRPHPGGREVRLHQGFQVLHVCDVVDPAGDQPRHGRPGPHHPAACPPRRAGQQARSAAPRAAPAARPRRDLCRAGRGVRDSGGEDRRPAGPRP